MAESNIREDIAKKSAELARSNEELAAKLRKNEEILARLEKIDSVNQALKTQVTEKESIAKVLKDKLTEKTHAHNTSEQKINDLTQELEKCKKHIFAIENRAGVLEKRVFSTDEQNQKLLYELMRFKEQVKNAEEELANKEKLLTARQSEQALLLERFRKEEKEKKVSIMKNHSKKLAVMNAAIASLKTKLEEQQRMIDEKAGKERALIEDFNRRMQEIMMTKPEFTLDLSDVDKINSEPETETATSEEKTPESFAFETEEEKETESGEETSELGSESEEGLPSKIEEIIPMIELAVDHGDDSVTIKHSLKSSGYSEKDIEEAFSKLNIVEQ
jgi:peptidoglycan hydrolase CwlO-like protein